MTALTFAFSCVAFVIAVSTFVSARRGYRREVYRSARIVGGPAATSRAARLARNLGPERELPAMVRSMYVDDLLPPLRRLVRKWRSK